MEQTLKIVRVQEPKPDKNGTMMKCGFTEEFIDSDGCINAGIPVAIYNETLWDRLQEGTMVKIRVK